MQSAFFPLLAEKWAGNKVNISRLNRAPDLQRNADFKLWLFTVVRWVEKQVLTI